MLLWLEQGGIVAIPNIRGGGEYGEEWHQGGMLGKKQNSFDDFIAAAEWLVARGLHHVPSASRSAGGSNGGLLMGAALTQRPELFRAVVVPGAAARHAALSAVSDRAAVGAGVRLAGRRRISSAGSAPIRPITTCARARSIRPCCWRPRRATPGWTRCTRARWPRGFRRRRPRDGPVLLRLESRAGHGAGKPISKVLDELTDTWTFVFSEIGVEV